MSNEEMQKKMEFIIDQQAQLVVNQEKADERLTRLENIVVRFYEDTETKMGALIDAQVRTETKMAELAEAQLRTDERLNTLVAVVERVINEGRNDQLQS
jgi:predicted negative regulator of RcsB-dependent stress response